MVLHLRSSPSGAKAQRFLRLFAARLKSCPDTKPLMRPFLVDKQTPACRLLRWVFRCKWRAAGLLRGVEVHQLQPDSVGVVEIELALAVFADLGVAVVPYVGQAAGVLESLVCRVDRVHADGEMVEHAEFVLRHVGGNS